MCDLLNRIFKRSRHFKFTFLTALGSDQNHAVGTTHTEHCSCRCIFEYRNTLDLTGIDDAHIVAWDTVYEDKWGCTVDGTSTTQPESDIIGTGFARGYRRSKTWNTAGQRLLDVGDGGTKNFIALYATDSSRKSCLLLSAVTNYYDLIEDIGIFGQNNPKMLTGSYLYRFISNIRNKKLGASGNLY